MLGNQEENEELARRLLEHLSGFPDCMVAFSGGVDSAVVAAAAHQALGDRALAAIGIGPAVSQRDRDDAHATAARIGIRLVELPTLEIQNVDYRANDGQRCFHCKNELYGVLGRYAKDHGWLRIANGTNLDDLGDYRPGLQAATEHQVTSPLVDCHMGKAQVRQLASFWNLPISSKPASPCLASRIAYGQEVTPERLRQIEEAETWLRQTLQVDDLRVRWHPGPLARIEAPDHIGTKIVDPEVAKPLVTKLKSLGFLFVTFDLGGRKTGSLNQMLPVLPSPDGS
ncbi:MAG: ATP-dependent sacrificial sulfur transferase LarE [Pirellulaceae bacterium]